ncbi:hypothetical protein ASZ90_018037 [hydrocarbon metagenome]|uniref:Uncharacterized protein n=1 Tax=hydrocarbon metagenome TaxID=938273 RepID=A0A0W8E7E8_9ZZZZ
MKSAGYDIVVLLNEKFLNQVTGALFYNGFLRINGSLKIYEELDQESLDKIPESLYRFLVINYRMKLNFEPSIDFLPPVDPDGPARVRIHTALRVYFWLWDGLEIKFDANVSLAAGLEIDSATNQMRIDFANSDIESLALKYRYNMEQTVTLKLDQIMENAIRAYLSDQNNCFSFNLPSINPLLPYMEDIPENYLPLSVRSIKTLDATTMAIAVNIDDYEGGDQQQLSNFARNCSAAVAVPEIAMYKVYDFFWERTNWDKSFKFKKSFESETLNDVVNVIGKVVDIAQRIVIEIATLGFVETHYEMKGMRFEVGADVKLLSKPEFDLMPDNKVKIKKLNTNLIFSLKVFLDVEYSVEIDPTGWFPDVIPDYEVVSDRVEVKIFELHVPFFNMQLKKGVGKVFLDDASNTLQIKIEQLDLYWDFIAFTDCPFINFPEWLFNKILDLCESSIAEAIPPIVITPSFTVDVPLVDWDLKIEGKKLTINADEAILAADIYFAELKKDIPYVPKYIININNQEIHKIGCDSLMDTYEEHQRGYHLLNDAVNRGYDGCKRCLPAYHTK